MYKDPSHNCGFSQPVDKSRRHFLVHAGQGVLFAISAGSLASIARALTTQTPALPKTVAGIRIPDTPVALAAMDITRQSLPPLLFNHSMRVYVFAALVGKHDGVRYDDELLMTAAAFHDAGWVEKFSTPDAPYELDGADAAKRFLVERGVSEKRAELVWKMIALHNSNVVDRFLGPIRLISYGATIDFVGTEPEIVTPELRDAAVAAFPRLGFKKGIQKILTDFCQRKPMAQSGGWGDVYCRSHTVGITYRNLSDIIENSPFRE